MLVPLCCLLRLSVTVSPHNAHELARSGGLEPLAWLLRRALSQLTAESPPDCAPARVAADALHALGAVAGGSDALCASLASSEQLRSCVADAARALQLRHIAPLLEGALRAVDALSASPDAEAALSAGGAPLLLLLLCLQYDATAEGADQGEGEGGSAQLEANGHALLAVRALRALCGYSRGEPAGGAAPFELHGGLSLASVGGGSGEGGGGARAARGGGCAECARALLPAALGEMLADGCAPEVLLRALNGSCRTPHLIWSGASRAQLAQLLADAAAALWRGAESFDPVAAALGCAYEQLAGELLLGGVYVRVFCEQPDFRLRQPRAFARALLELAQETLPAATAGDGSAAAPQPELCLALDALRLLLRRMGDVEPELLGRRRLDTVLRLVSPAAHHEVATRALACALALSASAACVDALAAAPAVWASNLALALHECPLLSLGALRLLRALAAAPDAVGAMLGQGVHVLALRLLLEQPALAQPHHLAQTEAAGHEGALTVVARGGGGDRRREQAALPPAERRRVREAACALLGRMAADRAHGEAVRMACGRLLPPVLLDTIAETAAAAAAADSAPSASVAVLANGSDPSELEGAAGPGLRLLDGSHDNPELIWGPPLRAQLLAALRPLCEQLAAAARAHDVPSALARCPPAVAYAELASLLCLGGVFLGRFVRSSGWPLRRPAAFLRALVAEWNLIVPAAAAAAAAQPAAAGVGALVATSLRARPSQLGAGEGGAGALPARGACEAEWADVCEALALLLHAEPALARELAAMGVSAKFTSQCTHADPRVQRCAVAVTQALAGSADGLSALRRYESVAPLAAAVAARCERAECVLAALTRMAAVPDLAGQAVRCGLPGLCASLLDGIAAAYAQPQAVRVRAHRPRRSPAPPPCSLPLTAALRRPRAPPRPGARDPAAARARGGRSARGGRESGAAALARLGAGARTVGRAAATGGRGRAAPARAARAGGAGPARARGHQRVRALQAAAHECGGRGGGRGQSGGRGGGGCRCCRDGVAGRAHLQAL